MDPNELLMNMLLRARHIVATSSDEQALMLADDVLVLNEWMAKGGFPPIAWKGQSL